MAEFQELIKNFDRIRDYMRQFYVYGFKVRNDFDEKSARTYDNERRRIESWLGDYMRSDYTAKGKQVYINVDSKMIPQNPLYAAWKAKSFTDNDIMLHFFILDQLMEAEEEAAGQAEERGTLGEAGLSAGDFGDRIAKRRGVVFDNQTIRLKLKEYEELGLLEAKKKGKALLYYRKPAEDLRFLLNAIKFFQAAAPFGFVGSTILDREDAGNNRFQFKHHFIVHTLEDGVLLEILEAMKEKRRIEFTNKSTRTGRASAMEGLPLRIFVSTRAGRRYVCCYLENRRRFVNYRLDCITQVKKKEECQDYEHKKELLEKNLKKCWGVSFGGPSRLEEICVRIFIDEEKEPYILNRLYREGRGGEVLKIREHEYLYSGAFFDTNEMLSWIKSFTGRVLDIQGVSRPAIDKITRDWDRMYEMYCQTEPENTEKAVDKSDEDTKRL